MRCDWPILGAGFSRNATGIMSYVNARQVKREYRKCESTFDSNSSNDLKLNEKRQCLSRFLLFLVRHNFLCEINQNC